MTFTEKDKAFMRDAKFLAENHSKDRSTKVGALILGDGNEILSAGYNGFCRLVNDDIGDRHIRPLKLLYTEHAERNAIYNAARSGVKLLGSRIYVTTLCPCPDCSRAIIQSGISKVYLEAEAFNAENPRSLVWMENWEVSKQMFDECGVEVVVIG